MITTIAVARPVTRRRDLPRSQRVAPMTVTTMTLEATARALAPQPDSPLVAVVMHLRATHEQMAGRHVAPIGYRFRVRNAAALREMREVTR